MNLFKKRKIYFYHIRKTGGSSINYSLLSGLGNPEVLYKELSQKLIINANGKNVIGWNVEKLNKESYFYGFSHNPFEQIVTLKNTYTITVLRDPFERITSHYKMLKMFEITKSQHPVMKTEGLWIEKGVQSFINQIPKEHLLRQLYMFSTNYSVLEAMKNVNKISKVISIKSINSFISNDLSEISKMELKPIYRNESKYSLTVEESEMLELLKPRLEPEYELLDKLNLNF